MALPPYSAVVANAVTRGLAAAAVFEVDGKPVATAGAIDDDEVRAIGMLIARPLQSSDPLARMLDGEMLLSSLGERMVLVGIAARCVFVAAVVHGASQWSRARAYELRDDVEREISRARADFSGAGPSGPPGSGGSSSGPAELPVIEIGITVPRKN
jgi:hypothetical protein